MWLHGVHCFVRYEPWHSFLLVQAVSAFASFYVLFFFLPPSRRKCFRFVCWFACRFRRLLDKLWINVGEIFGRYKPWDNEQSVRFWGDLRSDLYPGILFLFHLFAVCEIVLSLGVLTIMLTILVMHLISVLFNTHSLAEVCIQWSCCKTETLGMLVLGWTGVGEGWPLLQKKLLLSVGSLAEYVLHYNMTNVRVTWIFRLTTIVKYFYKFLRGQCDWHQCELA